MSMKRTAVLVAVMAVAAAAISLQAPASGKSVKMGVVRAAATGQLRPAVMTTKATVNGKTTTISKQMPFLSGGVLAAAQEAMGLGSGKAVSSAQREQGRGLGMAVKTLGCADRTSHGNVRVNQDCTYRRQAENDIAYNPANPENLIAGQNDSRVGWNQTSIQWSIDNGRHWGDIGVPPHRYRLNAPETLGPAPGDPNRHTILGDQGTLHSYDACSDPAVAFDSQGRGFYSAICFDIVYFPSLLYVTTSPLGARGSYFDQVPPPYGLIPGLTGREHIVAEDNSIKVFHDKQFITADTYRNSPNRDNVYVTWTLFLFAKRCGQGGDYGYCASLIYGSMSTDHGFTWSTPELVSRPSPGVCYQGNFFDPRLPANACAFNQGSDPAVLPNGELVVSFSNENTPANDPNFQVLATHCNPRGSSPAGTARLNCGTANRVGAQIVQGSPRCDFGRGPEQCIPGNFVRAPYETSPRIAVNERNGNVFVTWFDYRATQVGRKAFVVNLARSTNQGRGWSNSIIINPDSKNDHYFPAIDVAETSGGSRIGISFYRTERIPNENNTPPEGWEIGDPGVAEKLTDYRLAGGTDLSRGSYRIVVLSPETPAPDGIQAGFLGDYTGLVINRDQEAHPIWSDTRNRAQYPNLNLVTVDEDAFTDTVQLPGGQSR